MGENLLQWHTLAILLAGALAGGFVNGLTGFGTGLTALPLWLQALEPVLAAQLVSAASIVGHVTAIPSIWARVDWRRLAPAAGGGTAGRADRQLAAAAYSAHRLQDCRRRGADRLQRVHADRRWAHPAARRRPRRRGRGRPRSRRARRHGGPVRRPADRLGRPEGLAQGGAPHRLPGVQHDHPVRHAGGHRRARPGRHAPAAGAGAIAAGDADRRRASAPGSTTAWTTAASTASCWRCCWPRGWC